MLWLQAPAWSGAAFYIRELRRMRGLNLIREMKLFSSAFRSHSAVGFFYGNIYIKKRNKYSRQRIKQLIAFFVS